MGSRQPRTHCAMRGGGGSVWKACIENQHRSPNVGAYPCSREVPPSFLIITILIILILIIKIVQSMAFVPSATLWAGGAADRPAAVPG